MADHGHRDPRGRGDDADRLAVLPGRAGAAAHRAGAVRLRAHGAAGHPRRLRPPARAVRVPRDVAGRGREHHGAHPGEAGRGPARAARRGLRHLRGAPAAARPGPGPVAAGARQARPRRGGAGAASDRGPHGRRDGDLRAVAGRALRGRLRVRRGDPVDARERRPGRPTAARSRGWPAGGARGGDRAGPRHAAHPRAGAGADRARTRATSTRSSAATTRCPRAATPRPSAPFTPRTGRACNARAVSNTVR